MAILADVERVGVLGLNERVVRRRLEVALRGIEEKMPVAAQPSRAEFRGVGIDHQVLPVPGEPRPLRAVDTKAGVEVGGLNQARADMGELLRDVFWRHGAKWIPKKVSDPSASGAPKYESGPTGAAPSARGATCASRRSSTVRECRTDRRAAGGYG